MMHIMWDDDTGVCACDVARLGWWTKGQEGGGGVVVVVVVVVIGQLLHNNDDTFSTLAPTLPDRSPHNAMSIE